MKPSDSISERIRHAFTIPTRGVVGLVDELLAISADKDIYLSWCDGLCRVVAPATNASMELEVSKSVFRAALARLAALCGGAGEKSPYGGSGEIRVDGPPAKTIRVKWVNTSEEQSVELFSAASDTTAPPAPTPVEQLLKQ